jgi:hypothetical protein
MVADRRSLQRQHPIQFLSVSDNLISGDRSDWSFMDAEDGGENLVLIKVGLPTGPETTAAV